MKKLLEYIIEGITKSKDFKIEDKVEGNFHEMTLFCKPELIGLIIGKNGKVIKTIRNLLKVHAVLDKISFNLSVSEDKDH